MILFIDTNIKEKASEVDLFIKKNLRAASVTKKGLYMECKGPSLNI